VVTEFGPTAERPVAAPRRPGRPGRGARPGGAHPSGRARIPHVLV